MKQYRILSFDKTTMHATIQFEGQEPFNYALPLVDGLLPTGEALQFWIKSLHLSTYSSEWYATIPNVSNTNVIEDLVNPEALPYIPRSDMHI